MCMKEQTSNVDGRGHMHQLQENELICNENTGKVFDAREREYMSD